LDRELRVASEVVGDRSAQVVVDERPFRDRLPRAHAPVEIGHGDSFPQVQSGGNGGAIDAAADAEADPRDFRVQRRAGGLAVAGIPAALRRTGPGSARVAGPETVLESDG